jgi:hypothetical protein
MRRASRILLGSAVGAVVGTVVGLVEGTIWLVVATALEDSPSDATGPMLFGLLGAGLTVLLGAIAGGVVVAIRTRPPER